jgi:hypothetical protein
MQEPAHHYAPSSTLLDTFLSRCYPHCFDADGNVDEDALHEALLEEEEELVVTTSVAEAVQCDDIGDDYYYNGGFFSSSPPPVLRDNDASTTTTVMVEGAATTTLMAQTVRFVLRCVGSGLVVGAAAAVAATPVIHCTHSNLFAAANHDTDVKADEDRHHQAFGGHADEASLDEEPATQEDERGVPSSPFKPFKLHPRCVGCPSQEWTMVSTTNQGDGGNRREYEDGVGTGTTTSKVQLINMATMQRLVCSCDAESPSRLELLTPRQYRKALEDDGNSEGGGRRCRRVDAAWTLSSEGTILSSATGLALTDDGDGNLTLRPPSPRSLSVEQQWQLIPIV